ncbi:unnamed protein product [Cylindrotheca closterium]|uniref:Ribosomal RNA-processing protein 8 n=1 Tax=Cylindrotheca closterium TaxID=2856 RepID=A0AAD2CJ36_9STRA|nr:unnamed protein product [Cylindrotheca closterium]
MVQKKKISKGTGKTLEAKSAAAGKIQKPKHNKKNVETTIVISKMADNVQKIMETTTDGSIKKGKQEKGLNDGTANKNENKDDKKRKANNQKKNKNQEKNQSKSNNKKQKKNPDTGNKGKKADNKEKKEPSNNEDGGDNEQKWSKSKKKRLRGLKAKQNRKQQKQDQVDYSSKSPASKQELGTDAATESSTPTSTGSKLQNAFKARLSGSRFRILNEELYTKDSKDSFARFSQNPELFEQYHEGFRHQVASWPVNPVDVIVRWIVNRYSSQIENQHRNKKSQVAVADFGCGDAQLAKDLMKRHPDAFQIHSFDLVSHNNPELVTACDMANVPLKDKSVDVVVFCLALMGTNLADFIREAHRVLKDNGRVQIAEVRSRIEYSHGRSSNNKKGGDSNNNKDDNDSSLTGTLDEFVQVLSQLGFESAKTDRSNKMFLFLELKKNGKAPNKKLEFSAKPCIYKRR